MARILSDSSCVVTGGASGIGRALCEAIAVKGARVLVADIDIDRAHAVAEGIRCSGGEASAVQVDVTDTASTHALANHAFAVFGEVSHLFLNAGVGAGGSINKIKRSVVEWVFAVNFYGVIDGSQAFAPRMLEQKTAAHIIITGSEHSLGLPPRGGEATPYTASKHAVHGLAAGMARDYVGTNLSVSLICPGLVQSDIWNSFRNRPEKFGGPRQLDEKWAAENKKGLPAHVAAERILDGLAADEFYLFTHGNDIAEVSQQRAAAVAEALARFQARYGPDA